MKSLILFGSLICGSLLMMGWYQNFRENRSSGERIIVDSDGTSKEQKSKTSQGALQRSIFIPYWNIPKESEDTSEYDELYYFGIAPDENGEIIDDSGLRNLGRFVESTSIDKKRLVTIRMLNTEINSSILQDPQAQDRLISQTLRLVEEHDFDGVVLDLEMGVIPFDNVMSQITTFVTRFSGMAKEEDAQFYMTIYGDTFYRQRPYDIEKLEPLVDRFLVMAYDFHKSRGEPGPNFPLTRRSGPPLNPLLEKEGNQRCCYGYDLKEMIEDFKNDVPNEKLTILFGMYGYDWTLGPQGLPLKAAKAIPLYQIETGYGDCPVILETEGNRGSRDSRLPARNATHSVAGGRGKDTCSRIKNAISQEKHILYSDDEGYQHILWYEDEESVEIKIKYLEEQGIGSVGYWVWGYF